MAQQNENNHSLDSTTEPGKRKRGRPRKEDAQGTHSGSRTQRRRHNPLPAITTTATTISASTSDDFVGQQVSGILDGAFDSGFLITVRVNNGNMFKGMVFDSRLAIPITASNDVAPYVKMYKGEEFEFPVPISAEPLRRREPIISEVVNSKAEALVKVQVSDGQSQGWTGELKLDSTSKTVKSTCNLEMVSEKMAPTGDDTTGELKLDSTIKTSPCNESLVEMELDSTDKATQTEDTTGKLKMDSTSNISPCTSKISPCNKSPIEMELDSTENMPQAEDTMGELKLGSPSKAFLSKQTSEEQKFECQVNENSSVILPPRTQVKNDSDIDQSKPSIPEAVNSSSEIFEGGGADPVSYDAAKMIK